MRKHFLLVIICSILFACNNVEIKKEYYSNGRIMSRKHLIKGVVDTFEYYYPNDYYKRKIIYNKEGKIVKDLISDFLDSTKFVPFRHSISTTSADKDSIIIGEHYEAKIFLITPAPDSIKYIRIVVGDSNCRGSYDAGEGLKLFRENEFLSYAKYDIVPKDTGVHKFYGLIKCVLPGEHTFAAYPFARTFLVKAK